MNPILYSRMRRSANKRIFFRINPDDYMWHPDDFVCERCSDTGWRPVFDGNPNYGKVPCSCVEGKNISVQIAEASKAGCQKGMTIRVNENCAACEERRILNHNYVCDTLGIPEQKINNERSLRFWCGENKYPTKGATIKINKIERTPNPLWQ